MSDLVKDLPAEYRTPSLESLPEELQVLAVEAIQEKFGLKKKPVNDFMDPSTFMDRFMNTFNDLSISMLTDFADPSIANDYNEYWKVHIDVPIIKLCTSTVLAITGLDRANFGLEGAIENAAKDFVRISHKYYPRDDQIRITNRRQL